MKLDMIERKNDNFHFEPVQHFENVSSVLNVSTGFECSEILVNVGHL